MTIKVIAMATGVFVVGVLVWFGCVFWARMTDHHEETIAVGPNRSLELWTLAHDDFVVHGLVLKDGTRTLINRQPFAIDSPDFAILKTANGDLGCVVRTLSFCRGELRAAWDFREWKSQVDFAGRVTNSYAMTLLDRLTTEFPDEQLHWWKPDAPTAP